MTAPVAYCTLAELGDQRGTGQGFYDRSGTDGPASIVTDPRALQVTAVDYELTLADLVTGSDRSCGDEIIALAARDLIGAGTGIRSPATC